METTRHTRPNVMIAVYKDRVLKPGLMPELGKVRLFAACSHLAMMPPGRRWERKKPGKTRNENFQKAMMLAANTEQIGYVARLCVRAVVCLDWAGYNVSS